MNAWSRKRNSASAMSRGASLSRAYQQRESPLVIEGASLLGRGQQLLCVVKLPSFKRKVLELGPPCPHDGTDDEPKHDQTEKCDE
jgi:hypothetical protein